MDLVASVIVPVHDAEATLAEQLAALANQVDAPEFEVVVVLNRCSDQSRKVGEAYAAELRLALVEANDQSSAAYARNVGVSTSSAPVLLFCDADDHVSPRWVAEMVDALRTGGADFVGGRIVVDRAGLPDWIYDLSYQWLDGSCIVRPSAWLPYVMSASLGCHRDAFESIGGFDESFHGAGCEEMDLAARLLRAGFRIGEAPGALLSYRPRTAVRGMLEQTRGYARGLVTLAAKEGRLGPAPTRRTVLTRTARTAGYWVVRQREWRPHVVAYQTLTRYYRLDAERKFAADAVTCRHGAASPPLVEDFVAPVSTPLIGGLALQARPASARWYAGRGVEPRSLALVEALLPERGRFVDCGANVGVFTLAAAFRVGPEGHVIAFEPDPRTRTCLGENLRRHRVADRVEVRSHAVGASQNRPYFNQYAKDLVSGFDATPETFDPGDVVGRILVEVVQLNDAVDRPVDMVKIHVEGFETAVLAGAKVLLDRCLNVTLIVECNPASLHDNGETVDTLLQYFPSDRWALWLIDERADEPSGGIRPFDAAVHRFVDSADADWYGNVLAARLHRRDDIQALIDRILARSRRPPD